MSDTQISAFISKETRDKVERYADAHGLKKGALVEQALLHHLQALRHPTHLHHQHLQSLVMNEFQ